MLVARHVQLNFGKHDWRMFVVAFGVPAILGGVLGGLGILGPNGY